MQDRPIDHRASRRSPHISTARPRLIRTYVGQECSDRGGFGWRCSAQRIPLLIEKILLFVEKILLFVEKIPLLLRVA
jgi:hypothetical protein